LNPTIYEHKSIISIIDIVSPSSYTYDIWYTNGYELGIVPDLTQPVAFLTILVHALSYDHVPHCSGKVFI